MNKPFLVTAGAAAVALSRLGPAAGRARTSAACRRQAKGTPSNETMDTLRPERANHAGA